MAWFADLARCTYFGRYGSCLRAIGWLEHGHDFATGPVEPQVVGRLTELLKTAWAPVCCAGFHTCDLCVGQYPARGAANLFVPGKDAVYICPELVIHYISNHSYSPPEEFCDAAMNCPAMNSPEYFQRLWQSGSGDFRELIEASRAVDDGLRVTLRTDSRQ